MADRLDFKQQIRVSDVEGSWGEGIVMVGDVGREAKARGVTGGFEHQDEAGQAAIVELEQQLEADREDLAQLRSQARVDRALIAELLTQGQLDRRQIETLETALVSARRIGAALGIVMATAKLDEHGAFEVLRDVSQNSNRKLRDVAEDVIYTGTLPTAGSAGRSIARG